MTKKLLTFPELADYGIPYCRVHINSLVDAGEFPRPIQLSANRIAWRVESIETFLEALPVQQSRKGHQQTDAAREKMRAARAARKARLTEQGGAQ